jgi:hypothetical protein
MLLCVVHKYPCCRGLGEGEASSVVEEPEIKFENSTTADCIGQVMMGGSVGYAPDVDSPLLIGSRILLDLLSLWTVNLFLINEIEAILFFGHPWFVAACPPSPIVFGRLEFVVSGLFALKMSVGGRPWDGQKRLVDENLYKIRTNFKKGHSMSHIKAFWSDAAF